MPAKVALDWIQKRDEADRAVWVDRYRNTKKGLGEVILETIVAREAMWELPSDGFASIRQIPALPSAGTVNDPPPPPNPHGRNDRKNRGNGNRDKKNGQGNGGRGRIKTKLTLKDGTKLCPAYQSGGCNAKDCKKGKHLCAGLLKTGRCCGNPHPAKECRNPKVLRE